MPMRIPADVHRPINVEAIRELKTGDALSHELINVIVERVKNALANDKISGYSLGDGDAQAKGIAAKSAYPVWITADQDIPAYSLIAVYEETASGAPVQVMGGKCGVSGLGSPLGLFTNDSIPIENGSKGAVRSVGDFEPALVKVLGDLPGVGEPCGVEIDTFGVTAGTQGFVCLSEPVDIGSGFTGEYVWIMRSQELASLVGQVTTQSTAFNSASSTLGEGVLKVMYRRTSDNVLVEAVDPTSGSAPWLMPFYSLDESTVAVGKKIVVDACVGAGLVYSPAGSGSSGSGSGYLELWGAMGVGSGASSRTPAADQQSLQGLYRANSFTDATTLLPFASGSRIYLPQLNSSGQMIVNQWKNDAIIYNPLPFNLSQNTRVRVSQMPLLTGSGSSREQSSELVYIARWPLDAVPYHEAICASNFSSGSAATMLWGTSSDAWGIAQGTALATTLDILCPIQSRKFRVTVCGLLGLASIADPDGWAIRWRLLRNGTQVVLANGGGVFSGLSWVTYSGKYAGRGDFWTETGVFQPTDFPPTHATDAPFNTTASFGSDTTGPADPSAHTHSIPAHDHDIAPHHHHISTGMAIPIISPAPTGSGALTTQAITIASSWIYNLTMNKNDTLAIEAQSYNASGSANFVVHIEPLFLGG